MLNEGILLDNKLVVGELYFDYELQAEVILRKKNFTSLHFGIVGMDNNDNFITGIFTGNKTKNIQLQTSPRERISLAISKDVFPKGCIIYSQRFCYYIAQKNFPKKDVLFGKLKGKGIFPYAMERNYEAEHHLRQFQDYNPLKPVKEESLIPYTFGIEYETSAGAIPENLCFKNGLIPLRDGSISGVEYASIVMNSSQMDLVKEQLKSLKKYTEFDKECSLHIHFGGFPIDPLHVLLFYNLAYFIQSSLQNYIPYLSFRTREYKKSGKDYCKQFNGYHNSFEDLYESLAGAPFLGSMSQGHPNDRNRNQKWHIQARYRFINIVNMCFYQSPKTIEFRFLRPTYNYNKLVNWMHIFSGMMLYVENFVKQLTPSLQLDTKKTIALFNNIASSENISTITGKVFPKEENDILQEFLINLNQITNVQSEINDYIGENTFLDDELLTTNVLKDE